MITENMKRDNISDNDAELRRMIRQELPAASNDPLFTRKVMNRLPEKRPSLVSWIERLGFLLAAVVLVVLWMLFGREVVSSGALTFTDLLIYGSFLALGLSLAVGMLRPFRN